MDADGTNVQRLTNLEELEGQAHSPAWSPDGTQIAYIGRISTLPWRLRIINMDGNGDHAITPENFRMTSVPDWAPDASRIMVEGGLGEDPDEFFTVEPTAATSRLFRTRTMTWMAEAEPGTTAPRSHRTAPGSCSLQGDHPQRVGRWRADVTARRRHGSAHSGDWYQRERVLRAARLAAGPVHWIRPSRGRQSDADFARDRVPAVQGPRPGPPTAPRTGTHGPPLEYPSCNPPVRVSPAIVGTPDTGSGPETWWAWCVTA